MQGAIVFWRYAILLTEFFGKVAGVVEAVGVADIGDALIRGAQSLGSLEKAELVDIVDRSGLGQVGKAAEALAFTDTG